MLAELRDPDHLDTASTRSAETRQRRIEPLTVRAQSTATRLAFEPGAPVLAVVARLPGQDDGSPGALAPGPDDERFSGAVLCQGV